LGVCERQPIDGDVVAEVRQHLGDVVLEGWVEIADEIRHGHRSSEGSRVGDEPACGGQVGTVVCPVPRVDRVRTVRVIPGKSWRDHLTARIGGQGPAGQVDDLAAVYREVEGSADQDVVEGWYRGVQGDEGCAGRATTTDLGGLADRDVVHDLPRLDRGPSGVSSARSARPASTAATAALTSGTLSHVMTSGYPGGAAATDHGAKYGFRVRVYSKPDWYAEIW
jgi:hypothetical protein